MKTTMLLLRHGATAPNLAQPYRLQGRRENPPLAPIGIKQAMLSRDFLAIQTIEKCYCSPLLRAMQTAEIIAAPHNIVPQPIEGLTECDVGQWEGLSWPEIQKRFPEEYRLYMEDPGVHGYPGGETFTEVYQRVTPILNGLMDRHKGQTILVIAHHIVNRTFLAGLIGLTPSQARQVSLENCSISVVVRDGDSTVVKTLNSSFHLQEASAA